MKFKSKKKNALKPTIAVLFLSTLTACSTASLSESGRKVEILSQMNRNDCKSLGLVFGKGGGMFFGGWISDDSLMRYASNDLLNHAAEMGATHVAVSTHQMGQTSGQGGGTTSTSTISGVAYRCPESVAGTSQ
jgi:Domain of unknown function (DUF4156)